MMDADEITLRWAQAVEALRQVQWSNDFMYNDDLTVCLCPLCDQSEKRGHSPDCLVGAAIENYDAQHPKGK